MSKNYSEQELMNTIKDSLQYIAESASKSVADVTVSDVKEYFAVNAESQDVDAEALAEDAQSSISHYSHEIENNDAQIERILNEVKANHE